MATSKRSLQLREDIGFERKQWRVQHASWFVVAALVVLALLGAFGRGPLSHATASAGELRVDYERFAHAKTPMSLRVQVMKPPAGTLRLAFDRQYLDTISLERLRPAPLRTLAAGDALVYEFTSPESGDFHLTMDATPQEAGVARAELRVPGAAGAPVLRFQQLIYP